MAFKFGKPKYGNNTFGNQWKPIEGDNRFRIVPPIHSLADQGLWSQYHSIVFGYCGVDPTDPNKTRQRPFRSIEERQRNGIVTQEDPAITKIEEVKKELEKKQADLISSGTPEDVIVTQLSPLVAWLKAHNVDRKHYLNVIREDGEVGLFTISHKTKKQLDEVIAELISNGIDPIDADTGVWFNIKRTGKMIAAVDKVEVVMENVKIDGRMLKEEKRAPISDEMATKIMAECKDLSTIGTRLTYEQVAELVKVGDDPEQVDRIFGGPLQQQKKDSVAKPAPVPTPKNEPVQTPANAGNSTADAVKLRLEGIRVKQALEKAEAEAAALAAAASPVDDASDLSDEEFVKRFGG